MINLLPYDMKKDLKAARTNSILLRLFYILLASAIFLGLLSFGVYMVNLSTKQKIEQTIKTTKSEGSTSDDVNTRYQALKQQITEAKPVFDSEIKYSDLLTSLAAATPEGVILSEISLSQSSFTSSSTLIFYAKSSDLSNTLHSKLLNSGLFSSVKVGKTETSMASPYIGYDVLISLEVLFNKGAA